MKYHNLSVDALANVQRTRVTEGKIVPAFSNRYDYNYFLNLEVYSDGAVDCDCHELIDLKLFWQKLQERWVTPQIPDGESIGLGRLGVLKVLKGKWIYDNKGFYDYVLSFVNELTPTHQNLFTYEEKKDTDHSPYPKVRTSIYREEKEDPYPPGRVKGKMIRAFYKSEVGTVNLVNLIIFLDRKVVISGLAEPITTDMDGLEKLIEQQIIITELPRNTEVTINGLGSFIAEQAYSIPSKEIFLEAYDVYSSLNKKPLHWMCQLALQEYMSTPTIATRDKLRELYEKLPHYIIEDYYWREESSNGTRLFHTSIRMILYGDQEIEKWPHYIALKEQGLELPNIVVPKPIDE